MICLICGQAETVDGYQSVNFERGEVRLTIHSVPARVCPNCGDACVEEAVAVRLLHDAEDKARAGIMDDIVEYMDFN